MRVIRIIFCTLAKVFVASVSLLVEIANLFLSNIVIYEATEGVRFDAFLLLKNPLFWIVLIINVAYFIISHILKQVEEETDKKVEKAIADNSIQIIKSVTKNVKKNNYESADKALKILDELQRRRK